MFLIQQRLGLGEKGLRHGLVDQQALGGVAHGGREVLAL